MDEPFTYKTNDSDDYYKLKFLLLQAGIKYTEKIEEPMKESFSKNPLKSLTFDSSQINKYMKVWKNNNLSFKVWNEKEGLTYVEFETDEDLQDAVELSQDIISSEYGENMGWIDENPLPGISSRRQRAAIDDWTSQMRQGPIRENMLPKPYKKVKCLECGEITNNDIDSKISHIYNKHNCKPSVDDYKAKEMLEKYFPKGIKEGVENENDKWELYHDVSILLKKYNINPIGDPYKWIYFEEGDIDGNIKIVSPSKLNIIYWVQDDRIERKNINMKDLEEILISWSNDNLI